MELGFIIALILVIPVMLIPVALIWYINIGGLIQAVRKVWQAKAAREKRVRKATNLV